MDSLGVVGVGWLQAPFSLMSSLLKTGGVEAFRTSPTYWTELSSVLEVDMTPVVSFKDLVVSTFEMSIMEDGVDSVVTSKSLFGPLFAWRISSMIITSGGVSLALMMLMFLKDLLFVS